MIRKIEYDLLYLLFLHFCNLLKKLCLLQLFQYKVTILHLICIIILSTNKLYRWFNLNTLYSIYKFYNLNIRICFPNCKLLFLTIFSEIMNHNNKLKFVKLSDKAIVLMESSG